MFRLARARCPKCVCRCAGIAIVEDGEHRPGQVVCAHGRKLGSSELGVMMIFWPIVRLVKVEIGPAFTTRSFTGETVFLKPTSTSPVLYVNVCAHAEPTTPRIIGNKMMLQPKYLFIFIRQQA